MRGRLLAYARYQLGDYLLFRAALPMVLALLFGFSLWYPSERNVGHAYWTNKPFGPVAAQQLYTLLMGLFISLGGFLGAARVVPEERSNGYFRFIFSKPVSLVGYYAQQWLVHGVAFCALTAGLAWLIGVATVPVNVGYATLAAALSWCLIGGIGFFLGTVTNSDALLLVLVWLFSSVLHDLKRGLGTSMWPWLRQLVRALPPTHKLSYLHDLLYAGGPIHWTNFWFVVGYGLAAFIGGLVVLRKTSLSR